MYTTTTTTRTALELAFGGYDYTVRRSCGCVWARVQIIIELRRNIYPALNGEFLITYGMCLVWALAARGAHTHTHVGANEPKHSQLCIINLRSVCVRVWVRVAPHVAAMRCGTPFWTHGALQSRGPINALLQSRWRCGQTATNTDASTRRRN